MKKLVLLLFFWPMLLMAQQTSIEEILHKFDEPGNAFRGKPFWSWNGELEEEELIRQVNVIKEMGMGGFFMHSRTGLKTEYLGDKWFDLINKCADEAEKLGLETWLYDEDRWPSGLAGGLVTRYPEYRARMMTMEVTSPSEFKADDKYTAIFSCRLDNLDLYDYKSVCVKKDGTVKGHHKPSSEFPFHKAIYEARPDIRAVIHAHPPAIVSFSIVRKRPNTNIIPQARNICGPIGYAEYAISGGEELGVKIAAEFKKLIFPI